MALPGERPLGRPAMKSCATACARHRARSGRSPIRPDPGGTSFIWPSQPKNCKRGDATGTTSRNVPRGPSTLPTPLQEVQPRPGCILPSRPRCPIHCTIFSGSVRKANTLARRRRRSGSRAGPQNDSEASKTSRFIGIRGVCNRANICRRGKFYQGADGDMNCPCHRGRTMQLRFDADMAGRWRPSASPGAERFPRRTRHRV